MRLVALIFVLAATAWSQAMTEAAAAAAGSTVGSVAGKQVSKGVDRILNKAGSLLGGAAKEKAQESQQPVLQVGPGVPKAKQEAFSVPLPPPLPKAPLVRRVSIAPPPTTPAPAQPELQPAAQPAPRPAISRESLQAVTPGMSRQDLLNLGAPASRISMYQDGRLVEVYRYMQQNQTIGVVRLTDGAVARVEVQ